MVRNQQANPASRTPTDGTQAGEGAGTRRRGFLLGPQHPQARQRWTIQGTYDFPTDSSSRVCPETWFTSEISELMLHSHTPFGLV